MSRDDLKAAVEAASLEQVDRRSVQAMRDVLARSRRVRPDALLAAMTEGQVKAVCERTGIDPTGRKTALTQRLLASEPKRCRKEVRTPPADEPPVVAEPAPVVNYAATYNDFERRFAEFLDRMPDILRFAALGTTEQGASGATFRVDYVKPSGAIGFYYPDWVAVQHDLSGQIINWVIETKGRVWEGTKEKDDAMYEWCQRVSRATGDTWKYIRVNQAEFRDDFPTFRVLVFTVVGNEVTRKREASGVTVTTEEILQWRDEGRRWL